MARNSDVVKKIMRFKLQLSDAAEPVLKILQKLKDLDITLDILSETGIGKTVNSLRRHKQAGELAKSLVKVWKKLVSKESASVVCKLKKQNGDTMLGGKSYEGTPKKHRSESRQKLKGEKESCTKAKPSKESSVKEKEPFPSCNKHLKTLKGAKDCRLLEMSSSSEAQNRKRKKANDEKHGDPQYKSDPESKKYSKSIKIQIRHRDAESNTMTVVDIFFIEVEKEPDFCEEESAVFTGQRLNKKMQVYSGAKTLFLPTMMSLYQQCIRTLQNNLNLLYETGGVPFELLEPVLERCTPEQLLRIEEFNPVRRLTDHLWGKHCQRDFKDCKLQEYESWKEMYIRLSEERERKLKKLTKTIVSAHSKKPKGEFSALKTALPLSEGGEVAPMMAKSLKAFKKQLGRR
uniref:Elongin A, like n=1 Tax=Cyprinodon variegatus TaxID=28743 RepID=A0A3Q2DCS8_CYPVA